MLDLHVPLKLAINDIDEGNLTGVYATTYIGAGLAVSYWFNDHVALNAGLDGALLAKANAGAPSLTLGIEFK